MLEIACLCLYFGQYFLDNHDLSYSTRKIIKQYPPLFYENHLTWSKLQPVPLKQKMTIAEVAEKYGLSPETLRYYGKPKRVFYDLI